MLERRRRYWSHDARAEKIRLGAWDIFIGFKTASYGHGEARMHSEESISHQSSGKIFPLPPDAASPLKKSA